MRRDCDNKNGAPKNAGELPNNVIVIVNCRGHGRHPTTIVLLEPQTQTSPQSPDPAQPDQHHQNQQAAAAAAGAAPHLQKQSKPGSGNCRLRLRFLLRLGVRFGVGCGGWQLAWKFIKLFCKKNNANQGKLASIQCANVA